MKSEKGIVKNIVAFDKMVLGSLSRDRDVMLGLVFSEDGMDYQDIFLTTEQAEKLQKQLEKVLAQNKEIDTNPELTIEYQRQLAYQGHRDAPRNPFNNSRMSYE